MTLSEIKGEQAIDVLAEIIEPATEIFKDEELVEEIRNGSNATWIFLVNVF